MKPKVTLSECIHAPDLGSFFSPAGNQANNPKGNPRASPKAVNPMSGLTNSLSCVTTEIRLAMKGRVHENETSTSVNAMKKIPRRPPFSESDSERLIKPDGSVISKTPRNDSPKRKKSTKNNMLKNQPVESSFSFCPFVTRETKTPRITKIAVIEKPYNKAFT